MMIFPFKICSKCKIRKSVEGFYRDRSKEDGRHTTCKMCDRKIERLCLEKHGEEIRLRDRKRWQKRKENPREIARRLEYQKRYRTPEIARAHNVVSRKLNLSRPDNCKICGTKCKPEAHHPDYKISFLVIWCCTICHHGIHANFRRIT